MRSQAAVNARNLAPSRFADLDAAPSHYNPGAGRQSRRSEGLLHLAGKAAFQRTWRAALGRSCRRPCMWWWPIMSLKDAWALMRKQAIKALPVVDEQQAVIGDRNHGRLHAAGQSGGA